MGRMADPGRFGLQKDYLHGLDNLRGLITSVEIELDKVKQDFYELEGDQDTSDLAVYEEYLKGINDKLHYCNDNLDKAGLPLEIIDSEMKLVELLNKIQDIDDEDFDGSIVGDLTEFWEHITGSLYRLKAVNLKFQSTVMKRLETICNSYQNVDTRLDFPAKYSKDVTKYQSEIKENIRKNSGLVKSFPDGINQDLFTLTNFSQCVLGTSDTKAYPILRIVPDISEKLLQMCRLARQWVDKDETYVHDISHQIRETRHDTRKKERELRLQKEKRSHLCKAVREAHFALKSYRARMVRLEEEVHHMEFKYKQYADSKKYKKDEIRQKEGMVGFLDISISQTKKNYSLQLKKGRIMRQLKDLEVSLRQIEKEVTLMEQDVVIKTREREAVEEKIEDNGRSYTQLKNNLDKFTENVDRLQQDMSEMAESLSQLEVIQTFKTSPEKVDDFYDRPQSVKLAPSLKEKIEQRKKLLRSTPQPETGRTSQSGEGFFITQ